MHETYTDDLDAIIDLYYYESAPGGSGLATGGDGAYCYTGGPQVQALAGTQMAQWVDDFAAHVRQSHRHDEEDFRVEYGRRAWRVCRCRDTDGDNVQISMRRLPSATPTLDDLSVKPPGVLKLLMSPWLNDGGLVMFCGLTGQGKTTVAGATIRSRIEKFGGRGVGVEDVLELPLEGVWGSGSFRQIKVDYQTQNSRTFGFAGAVRRAYRSMPATRPAVLYIGEVRDTETAVEVVKAASNGMLVITTIHSGSPVMGLMRLINLAEASMGEAATMAVAQSLRMVVQSNLQLSRDAATGWKRGTFDLNALVSDGPTHAIATQLAKMNYTQVANMQEAQHQKLVRLGAAPTMTASMLVKELGMAGA